MQSLEEVLEETAASLNEQLENDLSIKECEKYLASYLLGWFKSVCKREYEEYERHKKMIIC